MYRINVMFEWNTKNKSMYKTFVLILANTHIFFYQDVIIKQLGEKNKLGVPTLILKSSF